MASPAQATGSADAGAQPAAGARSQPGSNGTEPAGPPVAPHAARPPDRRLGDWALLAITAALTLPVLWLGYGTDLDIGDVRRTGTLIRNRDYFPSRNPGVPVFETLVAAFDPLGHLALNLLAALAAAAAVVGVARLVTEWGRANGDLVALAFLAAPITLISATSTTDFIYAVAFFIWGAVLHRRDRSLLAGVLFALAIGSRSSTFMLVAAFLAADAWAPGRRLRALRTGLVVVPLSLLIYVPPWLAYDRTTGFLEHTNGWRGLANNLGRFAYKNYAVAGIPLILVALVALPALVGALRAWNRDSMVRTAALGFVVTELLFLQLPWKPGHLLPALLMLVLWVAASERNTRPFLWLLIGAIALNGLVSFRPLAPDEPDQSQSARFEPEISLGLVANDVRCRARYMDTEPQRLDNDGSLDELAPWFCFLEPMRGPTDTAARPGAAIDPAAPVG
ncbi:MAG TPA: hypothetical protein VK360_08795 [Acidimicrobiales bacterium]|nr:hypothetical protein [Acidimicrobiales bacterium]